jgi:hypothetical protein
MLKGLNSCKTLDDFKKENASLGREAFLAKYLTNFIVLTCPLHDAEAMNFKTCSFTSPQQPGAAGAPNRTVARIHTLAKTGDAEYHMVSVGRTANNDIYIPHGKISKFHAYFVKDHKTGGTLIADAGSTNRTRVNMEALHPRETRLLKNGDKISFSKEVRAEFLTAEGMWALISQGGTLRNPRARYHAF